MTSREKEVEDEREIKIKSSWPPAAVEKKLENDYANDYAGERKDVRLSARPYYYRDDTRPLSHQGSPYWSTSSTDEDDDGSAGSAYACVQRFEALKKEIGIANGEPPVTLNTDWVVVKDLPLPAPPSCETANEGLKTHLAPKILPGNAIPPKYRRLSLDELEAKRKKKDIYSYAQEFFEQADKDSTTVGQILAKIESRLGAKLSEEKKQNIQRYLKQLAFRWKLQPRSSLSVLPSLASKAQLRETKKQALPVPMVTTNQKPTTKDEVRVTSNRKMVVTVNFSDSDDEDSYIK